MIQKLNPNQIIVVGTNLNGHHYGGAAAQAYKDFGLKWGVAEGISGQTYAFPTLDKSMAKQPDKELKISVVRLKVTCMNEPNKQFLLTKVGCGIAGFDEDTIKSIFVNTPKNLILPDEWR